MANWLVSYYKSVSEMQTAVAAIDNAVTIHVVPDKEGGFTLIKSA